MPLLCISIIIYAFPFHLNYEKNFCMDFLFSECESSKSMQRKSDPRNFCKNQGWRFNWREGESIQIRFSIFYENSSKKQTQFIKINKCIKDMMARHMYETNVFDGGYTTKNLSLSHFCCCCWNTVDTYGQLEKSCVMTSVVSGIFFL